VRVVERRKELRLRLKARSADPVAGIQSELRSRGEAQRHRLPGSEEGASRAPQSRRCSIRRPVGFVLRRKS
jgi:hypothetical protein